MTAPAASRPTDPDAGPLDIEQPRALTAWLRSRGLIAAGEEPSCTVLAGGVSNRTVLVEREGGTAWVVKQALARLRVEVEWFSSPERIHREALGLRWLAELAPPGSTTPPVFEDHADHLLGMAAVPRPHVNWKTMLLAGDLRRDHVRQFAALLGQVQRQAWDRRAELEPIFRDRSFFETLRLEPYWAYTADQVPAARAFLGALIDDIRARPITLVHGDYSPKNVLVHDGRLILLDHEVIHWGDPAFDLGFAYTHLLSKAHHVARCRLTFATAVRAHWSAYRDALGDPPWAADLEPRAVRATLGCLLARVAGRSPLEYLDAAARERQQAAVLAIIPDPPATIDGLADAFLGALAAHADH